MKGIWNGIVTMIACHVISCRTFYLFVLRDGFSQVFVVEVTMLSGLAFSFAMMLAARLLIAVPGLASGSM